MYHLRAELDNSPGTHLLVQRLCLPGSCGHVCLLRSHPLIIRLQERGQHLLVCQPGRWGSRGRCCSCSPCLPLATGGLHCCRTAAVSQLHGCQLVRKPGDQTLQESYLQCQGLQGPPFEDSLSLKP